MFSQPLWPGKVRQALVEEGFQQGVATRNSVPDDVKIRLERGLLAVETFNQFDTRRFQLGTHRRIDVGVATGDAMAASTGKLSDTAHEGTADTKDVNMHEINPG